MGTKLWLDDLRDPETFHPGEGSKMGRRALGVLHHYGRQDWTWVRSVPEAKALILAGGVETVSCDSDLGTGFEQGRKLVDWLEQVVGEALVEGLPIPDFVPKNIHAHTDNVEDRDQMGEAISKIRRMRAAQEITQG